MLTCEEISQLVSDQMDRDLGFGQRLAVRFHLLYCMACRRYRKQLRFLRSVMGHYLAGTGSVQPFPGTTLPEDARIRIRRALGEGS